MVPTVYLRWYQMGAPFVKQRSITGGDAKKRLPQVRDPCGSGLNPLRRIRVARPWPLVESLPLSCLLYRAGDRWLSRSPQKRATACRPRRSSILCVLVVCLGSASLSVFSSRDRLRRHHPHRGGINSVAAESGVSERSLSVQWSESSLRRIVLNVIAVLCR